jgi:DGQHR domain-containing protein
MSRPTSNGYAFGEEDKKMLNKKATKKKVLTYQSQQIIQNKHRFYFCTIPVSDLFPYCFVSRRKEDNIRGFQRELNEGRANDIANYLKEGSGSIPTNVVLSAQDFCNFKYTGSSKSISFDRIEKSFLVLDGQHRLWGYYKCLDKFGIDHRVPVSIYDNLDRATEARLFIDINTRQVGVPAALLLDIKQVAKMEDDKEIALREIFDRLNVDPKSPLRTKLSPAKSAAGKISRLAFSRAMEPAFDAPLIRDATQDRRYKLINNYLSAFDIELEHQKKLLVKASFFEAIFVVFEDVIKQSITQYKSAKPESIRKIIRPIAKFDYSGTGAPSKANLVKVMKLSLASTVTISDEMV